MSRRAGVPLVINDRIDIALATDADGVHVGQSDMPVSIARKLLGPDKIIGVSAKTPEQAKKAAEEGADYLGSGAVYPTKTKVVTINLGIDGLVKVCQSSSLPVVAIGGISTENLAEVMSTGLPSGVAIVSAVFDQPDVADATRKLRTALETYRRGEKSGGIRVDDGKAS
ncbi:hypothetical protein CBR_g6345 [Chara braunii]|uniref:thiamine phosphate synthase n=1 Tax=Chara braunii TaxID=69332 RepID=A0A388KJR9_CHABU|nr:hypothetical protein CBR_g6345 [Chara braunii]|eukprot:GBG70213.1 hypothetical protein CBR_g6345 [Chara braunii]